MMAKKADLPLLTHAGSLFTWTGNVGVAEASTLGRGYAGHVWGDSCDVGFMVRSHRTGESRLFVYDHEIGRDGAVEAIVYCALDESDIQVHVLND